MDHFKASVNSATLLQQFDGAIGLYEDFCSTTADLIKRLLSSKKVDVHSISNRCKDRSSFEKKITKKSHYKDLPDVTDLAGIRIITHYSDDVDTIAKIIEKEFDVDRVNSIDKRVALDPDRFGYLSLHYVATLKSTRSKLQEYSEYEGLKVEIQIRSILQHTWAEIEHDIGYKNEIEVPGPIKRKFSRLAGLLELADQEFISIRKEIEKYSRTLDKQMVARVRNIGLDSLSYEKFVTKNSACVRLDEVICQVGNYAIGDFKDESRMVKRLAKFNVTTIESLSTLLESHEVNIIRMVRALRFLPDDDSEENSLDPTVVAPGICCFYLIHVLAASLDSEEIESYVSENGWLETPGGYEFVDLLINF
ncbi:GTP pyrophosphokinase family protein [Pseudomonas asplenii]|uniref:GTP pyrophosphokinase n=1 Tax=Pseudomonas asplenii TaxID=53407 RepID=UPI0037CAF49B